MTGDGRPGDHRHPGPGRRRLTIACALLVAGGLAMWGSTALTWFSAPAASGTPVSVAGSVVQPVPVGVGLLALAGAAAAVAVSGIARRVLGAALVAAAVGGGVAVASTALAGPSTARLADLAGAAVPPTATVSGTAAPLLALAGALAVVAGGLVLLLRERGLPRLGARYAAPTKARRVDPDRAVWDDLDAGHDPTADPVADNGTEPAEGADRPPRGAPTRPGRGADGSDV